MTAVTDHPTTHSRHRSGADLLVDRDVRAGVGAMAPWLVGVIPFGLVVGLTAEEAGLSLAETIALTAVVYSGSAQLAATDALGVGSGIVVAIASVAIINARLIMYSSAIAPNWRSTSLRFRVAAALLLVDPSFAVGHGGYRDGRPHRYYFGAAVTLMVFWFAAVIAGTAVGGHVPDFLGLQFAVPLFLLAETVEAARGRAAVTAVVVGGLVGGFGILLPMHTGLLIAIVAGATAGVFADGRHS